MMGFEGHRLNDMIDLVEQAKPGDLESAGEALKKARDAIAAAATELGGHIDRVDWEGEAGQAFRKWGKNLVKDTHKLSDFAGAASVHLASAGAGLASVRSSMPPRDSRADPKTVEEIPSSKRVEGNEEYGAAVKAERHRQEAINQMNRLASFYLVSQDGMRREEPPTFSAMPKVGVPRPQRSPFLPGGEGSVASSTAGPGGTHAAPQPSADVAPTGPVGSDASLPYGEDARGPVTPPVRSVGTEIDSVNTLPPQTANPAPVAQTPPSGPVPNDTTWGPPVGRNRPNPSISGPTARTPRPTGGTNSPSLFTPPPQGRTGQSGFTGPGSGPGRAPLGPTGPSGPTAHPTAQGRNVSGQAVPGQPPVGRSVTGGTPRSLGTPGLSPGGPNPTGAARSQGVVGGRPHSGPAPGSAGPRASRGPVIGGQGPRTASAENAGAGQRGVVGARPQGAARGQTPRRALSSPESVAGAPRGRISAESVGRNGFTVGGTGLVRAPSAEQRNPHEEGDEDARRPDRSVEDEETPAPSGPRSAPPVVNQS